MEIIARLDRIFHQPCGIGGNMHAHINWVAITDKGAVYRGLEFDIEKLRKLWGELVLIVVNENNLELKEIP